MAFHRIARHPPALPHRLLAGPTLSGNPGVGCFPRTSGCLHPKRPQHLLTLPPYHRALVPAFAGSVSTLATPCSPCSPRWSPIGATSSPRKLIESAQELRNGFRQQDGFGRLRLAVEEPSAVD